MDVFYQVRDEGEPLVRLLELVAETTWVKRPGDGDGSNVVTLGHSRQMDINRSRQNMMVILRWRSG